MPATIDRFSRRRFLSWAACAFPSRELQAEKDDRAWELLRTVQDTYVTAVAYDVDFREESRVDLLGAPLDNIWTARMASLAPHHFFYQTPLTDPKSRKTPQYILCGDGYSVFTFSAYRNKEYIEEIYRDAHVAARRTRGGDEYLRFHLEHIDKYRVLAERKQKEPRYVGNRKIKVFGRSIECAVLETSPLDGSPFQVTETLWVETATNRVLRCSRHGYLISRGIRRRIPKIVDRTYRWRVLGQELPLDLFRFVPPKGSRRVEKFTPLPPRFISYPLG